MYLQYNSEINLKHLCFSIFGATIIVFTVILKKGEGYLVY